MKNIISFLLIFMVGALCFGDDIEVMVPTQKSPYRSPLVIPKSEVSVDDAAFARYIKEIVPFEYRQAMVYYTEDPEIKPFRHLLLGIADQESEGWKYFVSHKPNRDGSIDYSPMQLNSNNIKNKEFMRLYAPEDRSRITTRNTFYMVTAINYFVKYCLRVSKTGFEGALAMYNSNPNNYFTGQIPEITWVYVYRVLLKSERVDRTLEAYAKQEEISRQMAVEYMKNRAKIERALALLHRLPPYKPEEVDYVVPREELVRVASPS